MYLVAGNFGRNTDFYLAATEKDTNAGKIKTFIFLTCIGQNGKKNYEILPLNLVMK